MAEDRPPPPLRRHQESAPASREAPSLSPVTSSPELPSLMRRRVELLPFGGGFLNEALRGVPVPVIGESTRYECDCIGPVDCVRCLHRRGAGGLLGYKPL
jgi:hypothetical protein